MRAVSDLEEAAQLAPEKPDVQSDFSAAHLVRLRQKEERDDGTKALTAATAVTEADPSTRRSAIQPRACARGAIAAERGQRGMGGVFKERLQVALGARG